MAGGRDKKQTSVKCCHKMAFAQYCGYTYYGFCGGYVRVSRGLGRIERDIIGKIEGSKQYAAKHNYDTPVHVTARELAYACFAPQPHVWDWKPQRTHIKAATRAMHSIARKFPQYAVTARRSRRHVVLYEPGDPLGVLWAEMRMEARKKGNRNITCLMEARRVLAERTAAASASTTSDVAPFDGAT